MEYRRIRIQDRPHVRIQDHFDTIPTFMDEAKTTNPRRCVLVHCDLGVSLVLSYLMKTKGMSYEQQQQSQ
jgi:protein-tyrosine phosphatase